VVRHQTDFAGIPTSPGGSKRSNSCRVLTAVLSGLAVCAAVLALVSPPLRVRTVVWTGSLPPPEGRPRAFEAASLGRPLFLLPEKALRTSLQLDPARVRMRLHRHFPGTLEVQLLPHRAAVVTDAGVVLDARGRVLGPDHSLPGLTVLAGFGLEAGRLEPSGRRILATLGRRLDAAGLAPARIERRAGDLVLVLRSGTRVRLRADRLESDLLKLRLYEQSLGDGHMPTEIDLRFRDQVVVRGAPRSGTQGGRLVRG